MDKIAAFNERLPTVILVMKAICQLTFRVSDVARRRKVDGARTRGPHAVRYGDFDFALIPTAADNVDKRTDLIAARPIFRWHSGRGELVRLILVMRLLLLDR